MKAGRSTVSASNPIILCSGETPTWHRPHHKKQPRDTKDHLPILPDHVPLCILRIESPALLEALHVEVEHLLLLCEGVARICVDPASVEEEHRGCDDSQRSEHLQACQSRAQAVACLVIMSIGCVPDVDCRVVRLILLLISRRVVLVCVNIVVGQTSCGDAGTLAST